MGQLLLIPDPRPLDERLGRQFFLNAPKQPGVYLMRDADENVLYVGKAKNLRQRLQNYRTANPDRMPRRHLRMLRSVVRIELQMCADESAALERESKLLRSLKPKFNRAGVWPGKDRFLVWRNLENQLEFGVSERPESSWQQFGPLGANAKYLHQVLSRMMWLGVNADKSYAELPAGWAAGNLPPTTVIDCGTFVRELTAALCDYFQHSPDEFLGWLESRFSEKTNSFDGIVIELELEFLKEFSEKQKRRSKITTQSPLQ